MPVRRLSDLLRESPYANSDIELVKLDIEGSGEAALDGIDEQDWHRVKQPAVEVHGPQDIVRRVMERLRAKGFTAHAQADSDAPRGINSRFVYARR